jgi:hypothetical protein
LEEFYSDATLDNPQTTSNEKVGKSSLKNKLIAISDDDLKKDCH